MGIYIPNMEKPEFCDNCPLWNEDRLVCGYIAKVSRMFKCPIIDIVTCGECKHWYNDADCGMACEFTNMRQPSDGFCNWGERRSE